MKPKICEFEQQPKYPRCEKEATSYMLTRVRGSRSVKHRYCAQHLGFVMQQLKGTYVKVLKYGNLTEG